MSLNFNPSIIRSVIAKTISYFILLIILITLSIIFIPIFWAKILVSTIITLFFVVSWIITYFKLKNTKYKIDKNEVESTISFLSLEKTNIPSSQVTNISYEKGILLDKIFNTGKLLVYTSGSSSVDILMPSVPKVEEKYEEISNILGLNKSSKIDSSGKFKSSSPQFIRRVKPDKRAIIVGLIFSTLIFIPAFIGIVATIGSFGVYLLQLFFENMNSLKISLPFLGLGIILLALYSFFIYITLKRYERMYYDFYENKLEYYDGFLTLKKASVPLERITNINSSEQLLDKILGVSTIEIETAGSSSAEIVIRNVREGKEIVENLKEVLKEHGRD